MMLERQRTREAVVQMLMDANIVGNRVYPTRLDPLAMSDYPAIIVHTPEEEYDREQNDHVPIFNATLKLVAEIHISETINWDTILDQLSEQVEAAILENPEFVKEYSAIQSVSSRMRFETATSETVGINEITFELVYRVEFNPAIADSFTDLNIQITEPAATASIVLEQEV